MGTIKKLALMLLLLTLSVSGSAQSRNGQTYQDPEGTGNWYLMLEDFEDGNFVWQSTEQYGQLRCTPILDGNDDNHFMSINSAQYGYGVFANVALPEGMTFSEEWIEAIVFDIRNNDYEFENKSLSFELNSGGIDVIVATTGSMFARESPYWKTNHSVSVTNWKNVKDFVLYIKNSANGLFSIDNIRLKLKKAPTPTGPFTKNLSTNPYKAKLDDVLNLEVSATDATAYQWYKGGNATDYNGTQIDGATGTTYNVPTDVEGTYYYYCDATVNDEIVHSNIATVVVSASNSKNGKSYQEGDNWFLMLQDFEDNEIDDSYTVVNSEGGTAKVQADPKEVSEKSLNFITGSYKSNEYVKIDITLPTSVVLDDKFTDLYFDMVYNTLGDNDNKTVKVKIDSNDLGSISTGNAPKNWETKNYSLSGKTTSENSFSFCIGWENANYANYFIDNIRLKYKEAPTPVGPTSGDCGDDAHWAYDAATTSLTITGTDEMTDFAEGATPWNAYLSAITTIDVAEGITKVGANAFKGINSSAVLTFHSIPAFGADAVVEGEANLALVDANHPFVANTTENAPTFANISYARTLDANKWATVILPFVPEYDANTEFFKFKEATSSEATFQQTYSLEAGVPYVFRRTADSGDFTLSATNVAGSSLVVNPVNPSAGSVSFKGTFETLEKGYGVFAMKDNNFITVDAQHIITVAPFRAYLETLAPVGSTISIKVLDVTGIEKTISDEKQTPNVFYNLQGLRVNGNYKGVILMNGKKFIAQ